MRTQTLRQTTPSLLLLALSCSLTQGFRHLSYNERVLTSAKTFGLARPRLAAAEEPNPQQQGPPSVNAPDAALWRLVTLEPGTAVRALRDVLDDDDASGSRSGFSARSGLVAAPPYDAPADYDLCVNHTKSILTGLAEGQTWALKMVDAMGKPSPAISELNLLWPGAYYMCRKIRSNVSTALKPDFSGKYTNAAALIPVAAPGNLQAATYGLLGLCVPDTCSDESLTILLTDVANQLNVTWQVFASTPPHDLSLDTKAVVALVICSVLLVLLILGTALDIVLVQMPQWQHDSLYASANGHSNHEEHIPLLTKKAPGNSEHQLGVGMKALIAFSVYTNGAKLLSTAQPEGSLTCIHGIRFLSMTWVVLGHGFLFPQAVSANLMEFFTTSINRWTFQAVANALVSVDSFFVLSGLLVAYLTLKEMKKNDGRLNWFMFYFHRFWRLTPAYMLVIMVYVCLSPYWGEGPFWPAANSDRDSCEDNWWTNLLYVNNFVNGDKMCLGQSWYLANDMQFYCVLSPLVILPLYFAPLWGIVVATCLVLCHCVCNGVLTMVNHYPPGMYARLDVNATADQLQGWGIDFYMKPYTRMGPYVIGMLAGYFLYVKECKLNIKWYVNGAVWAVATGSALAVLYGLYGASTGHPMTLATSAFYNAVHRNVWGACLCWVIVACVTGNGGFVNTVLSWSAFVPLSRLTYCIYLLHILIMDLYVENGGTVFYFTDVNVVMFFLSVLIVSYMAATVATLTFEAPMMGLEKVVFPRHKKPADKQPELFHNGHHNGYHNGTSHHHDYKMSNGRDKN